MEINLIKVELEKIPVLYEVLDWFYGNTGVELINWKEINCILSD